MMNTFSNPLLRRGLPRVARRPLRGATIVAMLLASACSGSDAAQVETSDRVDSTSLPSTPIATSAPVVIQATPAPLPSPAPDRLTDRAAAPPVLDLGSEGSSVEDTQDLLNDFIGYADTDDDRIVEDGFFGPSTEAAMRSFEATVGIEPDGIATLDDQKLLEQTVADLEVLSAESVVALDDESVFVGTWQSRLNIWNDLVLELPTVILVDDRFGQDTEEATLAVEELLGLQVDGIVEPEDRAALRSAISDVRSQQDATILQRIEVDGRPVLVKALFVNDQYCLRFSVGYAADERCTRTPGGDLNAAFYVTINDVSFIAGIANPNVAFVEVATQGSGSIPLATRQIGDSLARAWVEVVEGQPDTIELREVDGSSILELQFSLAPTDRDFFGPTLSILSSEYGQSFFVDSCVRPREDALSLEGSLAGASIIVTVTDGVGSARISSGTASAPIEIGGTVTALDASADSIVITGEFEGALFDGLAFTGTTTCS